MTHIAQDIGAVVAVVGAIDPQNVDATADVNGDAVDRLDYGNASSCVIVANTGTATGSPTGQSHVFKIEHDDDDGAGSPAGTWSDLSGATVTITADGTLSTSDVDLRGAKRHIRLTYSDTSAFTAGTSPATDVSGCLVIGGADSLPLA